MPNSSQGTCTWSTSARATVQPALVWSEYFHLMPLLLLACHTQAKRDMKPSQRPSSSSENRQLWSQVVSRLSPIGHRCWPVVLTPRF